MFDYFPLMFLAATAAYVTLQLLDHYGYFSGCPNCTPKGLCDRCEKRAAKARRKLAHCYDCMDLGHECEKCFLDRQW